MTAVLLGPKGETGSCTHSSGAWWTAVNPNTASDSDKGLEALRVSLWFHLGRCPGGGRKSAELSNRED